MEDGTRELNFDLILKAEGSGTSRRQCPIAISGVIVHAFSFVF